MCDDDTPDTCICTQIYASATHVLQDIPVFRVITHKHHATSVSHASTQPARKCIKEKHSRHLIGGASPRDLVVVCQEGIGSVICQAAMSQ